MTRLPDRVKAEKHAAELLERLAVRTIPVPVEEIAASLGVKLVHESLDPTVSGLLLREGGTKLIAVNSGHHRRRQRFTVAHELGHLQMHKGEYIVDSTVRVNRRDGLSSMATNDEEIEANAFAAALLMPRSLVHEAIGRLRASQMANPARATELLAEQFGVSTEAMGYRLINLGLSS
ncbi:uncharacterized protein DUF955 [Promicromonospora sp. AC04]|uniref:ImmA/IrrE family metallo-endopeptidase n=1 Tax=Promicromonospora sp. AC04 TaxID=2135723 RepID=UPI000D356B6D|nr:ImmA/IrrE family metallo-endopeptidase [Promicromonospora sp. AC04]PUB27685.1 uncharacterized protein DUF955 [Promicromonospora sp. AC04]